MSRLLAGPSLCDWLDIPGVSLSILQKGKMLLKTDPKIFRHRGSDQASKDRPTQNSLLFSFYGFGHFQRVPVEYRYDNYLVFAFKACSSAFCVTELAGKTKRSSSTRNALLHLLHAGAAF